MFFKRERNNRWSGEATVIGQVGKIVFIRFGSRWLRVPTCRLVKKHNYQYLNEPRNHEDDEKNAEERSEEDELTPYNSESDDEPEADETDIVVRPQQVENRVEDQPKETPAAQRIETPVAQRTRSGGTWQRNELYEEANIVTIPKSRHSEDIVMKAKEREMQNWIDFEVMDEVEDKGQKTISTRWVVTEKEIDGRKDAKARLVVRGFEEEESHPTDAPTAAKSTLRIAIAIAANEGWLLETVDIKSAFLQGNKIEREVYIDPPEDLKKEGIVWRLRKPVYGLTDAARAWYFSLLQELLKLKFEQSQLDNAAFRFYIDSKLAGFLIIHVDDLLTGGCSKFQEQIVNKLLEKYEIRKREKGNFEYVGIDIQQDNTGQVRISQKEYVSEINEMTLRSKTGRSPTDLLQPREMKDLRRLTGQVLWASSQTRLDACFDALELSVSRNQPKVETMKRANKVVRKLKNNDGTIVFKKIDVFENLQLIVYADASFANLPDGVSSTAAYLVLLKSKNSSNCCVIDWCSTKIKRIVDNTLEAEAVSMRNALGNATYLGHLITEFYANDCQSNIIPILAFSDNQSLETNLRSTKQPKGKRVRIDLAEISRMIKEKEVQDVTWVDSKLQLADPLTKRDVVMKALTDVTENGFHVLPS